MGTFLNPGSRNFQISVKSDIFVDKTEMIQILNSLVDTQRRYVSVTRPRRFGKTMAADMICAYYGRGADSRKLFEKRKLAECAPLQTEYGEIHWDTYLGQFDVLRLVMTKHFKKNKSIPESLAEMQRMVIRDIKKTYPDVDYYDEGNLIQTVDDIYSENNRQLVIVIDEWDAVFRECQKDIEGQKEYLDFLRDLIKDNQNIALAYMTGILPIKKYGKHSALNMFTEYSMMYPRQLAKYTGFTEDEVQTLCKRFGRDYDQIRDWYDGYVVSETTPPDPDYEELKKTGHSPEAKKYALYSPFSVIEAISTGRIRNYWNQTETYEALSVYIRRDYDGLKESVALLMDGGKLRINTSTYQNDMITFHSKDDILSLLVHLGYLGFDDETSEVFIPNREILDEFRSSTNTPEYQYLQIL
ncbi:MAG: AAA family ATPase [Clostridia bacterium]|nr:AAA family ATPase [Clostridia bacterium]